MKIFKKETKKEEKEQEKTEQKLQITKENIEIIPIISEKSKNLAEKYNIYTFKIKPKNLNKSEIKKYIEKKFNVKVEEVRTVNYPKRKRGRTRIPSVRPAFKKAYVKLKKEYKIPIFE
ncbi:MAG: 50S ribosomal protein L23 [Minisyncoccia bacterium]|jgi:large subunit ribosomal protein L23